MSLIVPSRRRFLTGIAALVAAPAIVKAESIMRVKSVLTARMIRIVPAVFDHEIVIHGVDQFGTRVTEVVSVPVGFSGPVVGRLPMKEVYCVSSSQQWGGKSELGYDPAHGVWSLG